MANNVWVNENALVVDENGVVLCEDCPCDRECRCTCDLCLTSDDAPCCFIVRISDVVVASPEDCEDCTTLNRTYYVRQLPDDACVWKCLDAAGVDCDDSDDITLTLFLDGSDYKIKVELGGHIWVKNYGETKPDCCSIFSDELTHTTSDTDCDSSSAKCFITRRTGTNCPCEPDCDNAIAPAPPCFKIEWEGISPESPLNFDPPRSCLYCDCYSSANPQWIPWSSGGSTCTWLRNWAGTRLCSQQIKITISESGGTYSVKIYQFDNSFGDPVLLFQKDYASAPDVSSWVQEEIPIVDPVPFMDRTCVFAEDAKAKLTPDYTTSCADREWSCAACRCRQFDGGVRPDLQVTISGITGPSCCTMFNDTFILEPHPTEECQWIFNFGSETGCGSAPTIIFDIDRAGPNPQLQLEAQAGAKVINFRFAAGIGEAFMECNDIDMTFDLKEEFGSCVISGVPFPRIFAI